MFLYTNAHKYYTYVFLLMFIINVAVNTMSTIIDRFPSRSRSMSGVPVTRLQRIVSSMIILFVYFLLYLMLYKTILIFLFNRNVFFN